MINNLSGMSPQDTPVGSLVVPSEVWRVSYAAPGLEGGSFVGDRAHHASSGVAPVVVVGPIAPVDHDGLGGAGRLDEDVSGQVLSLQEAEEGLGGLTIETRPDPAQWMGGSPADDRAG